MEKKSFKKNLIWIKAGVIVCVCLSLTCMALGFYYFFANRISEAFAAAALAFMFLFSMIPLLAFLKDVRITEYIEKEHKKFLNKQDDIKN